MFGHGRMYRDGAYVIVQCPDCMVGRTTLGCDEARAWLGSHGCTRTIRIR